MQHQLDLHAEPDAVPRARRFVLSALDAPSVEALADDLALIVTELCTNAVLHAGPPITVRVSELADDSARVEVEDPDPHLPVQPQQSTDAMTGRGLALVAALASRWGVDPTPAGGKVVWAEVQAGDRSEEPQAPFQVDLDALDNWPDDTDPAGDAATVLLPHVPTDLLLATESTVDNLVREFALSGSTGGGAGRDSLPEHLATVVDSVTRGFSGPRGDIKRQANAAAAKRQAHCDLRLTLPLSAADDAEAYLAALVEADEYARAARLLTLESPPTQQVLRRWYVGELVAQLRASTSGVRHEPVPFEQRLLDELTAMATAQRSVERAARLQSVTAPLAAAETAEEVSHVVVSEGMSALGAARAAMIAPAQDRVQVLAVVGYSDSIVRFWESRDPGSDLPFGVVLHVGEPVWVENPQERDQRFPLMAELEPFTFSACAVPLISQGRVLAALRLSFDRPRLFDAEERQFVLALAGQAAQALHRSQAYAAERLARADAERLADHLADTANRLARLQRITADLTAARDPEEVGRVVVSSAASAAGVMSAVLYLLDDEDVLRVAEVSGFTDYLQGWTDLPLDADLPACEAVRTGEPVVVGDSRDLEQRYAPLRGVPANDRTVLVAPLSLRERRLGALVLVFPADQLVDRQEQLRFLVAIADASAQALERARATSRAADAADRLAFLAEASVQLSSSVDYRETLTAVARLVVPRLADWCSITLVEEDQLQTVSVAHKDPAKIAWARALEERFPPDPAAAAGVPNVIRTGESEFYPVVEDELLMVAARDEEHLRILQEVGMSSVVIVPLTGREGTFGAISMIAAESGRHYGSADLAFAEDLARRAALAVETAHAFREQSGRLAAVTRVADAAQRAILAPVPPKVGAVTLAATYVSATTEARVGGDLYEVVPRPGGVRLLIGDVRGKGLGAIRKATVVLGEFRAAAADLPSLVDVAVQLDRRLPAYLGDEDFVTALLADVADDGSVEVVACGHPPALLVDGGRWELIGKADSLPLGLGVTPSVARARLSPGGRLLLYTDGLLDARLPTRGAVDLADVVAPLTGSGLADGLDRILTQLREVVGDDLGDDLALLAAEFSPEP